MIGYIILNNEIKAVDAAAEIEGCGGSIINITSCRNDPVTVFFRVPNLNARSSIEACIGKFYLARGSREEELK